MWNEQELLVIGEIIMNNNQLFETNQVFINISTRIKKL